MEVAGKVIIVTGAAGGIGAALAEVFRDAGGRVVMADKNVSGLALATERLSLPGLPCDVTREQDIQTLVADVEKRFGPVDIFVSNAGILRGQPSHAASAPNDVWALYWQIHVMAHVHAARVLLPGMLTRGSGGFVQIASAAGLLNQIGDAAYSATKHAAVSFAESLAIEHGAAGIQVSLVCPQYVATDMLGLDPTDAAGHESLLTAEEVAARVLEGVCAGRFMILPHPQVSRFMQKRARDPEGWIEGMRALRARATANGDRPETFYRLI